jgi:lysozyme family protein
MASFNTAFFWTMVFEDPKLQYAQVEDSPNQYDKNGNRIGAFAISGINSAAFPTQFAKIAAVPQSQRGPSVQAFYQSNFWNSYYTQLNDDIAKRVFDEGINAGEVTAVKIFQKAINSLGGTLKVDGGMGPVAVAAANALDISRLVSAFQNFRLAHYQDIVAKNPNDAKFLGTAAKPGPWWKRAMA